MANVTITLTGEPSRSKQAGPCWIAAIDSTGTNIYAATKPRDVDIEVGETLKVTAKAVLRKASGPRTERDSWELTVTGNPEDTVDFVDRDFAI